MMSPPKGEGVAKWWPRGDIWVGGGARGLTEPFRSNECQKKLILAFEANSTYGFPKLHFFRIFAQIINNNFVEFLIFYRLSHIYRV